MNNDIQIYLDGAPVDMAEVNGSEEARISYDMNSDDGILAISFANALTFSGAAYAAIISALVNSPTAYTNSVEITIFATCCKASDGSPLLLFRGLISRAEISFCEFGDELCTVEIGALDSSPAASKADCIRNTIIHAREGQNGATSDGEDEGRRAVFFGYYDEGRPYSNGYLSLYLALYFIILITTILLLVTAISGILTFLSLGAVPFVSITDQRQFILSIALRKRYHKAVLINSYLQNACKLCGLQLRSPLFDSGGAYYNLTRLDAPYAEGGKTVLEAQGNWLNLNRSNLTFSQLLSTFRPLNIGYAVTETELIVDRINSLQNQLWIDFAGRVDDILEQCYSASDSTQPAGEIFKFADDEKDIIGNEFNRLWSGSAVDYNTPFNPILRGIRQTVVEYGSTRFVSDTGISAIRDIQGSVIFAAATVGSSSLIQDDLMLMSTGTCSAPKLLIWDGLSDVEDAKVLRQPAQQGGGLYQYNLPVWLNESTQSSFGVAGFYDNTLYLSDPRRGLQKNLVFKLRFTYICEDLRGIGYGKFIRISYNGAMVRAQVDGVEVNFDLGEMTITGKL